MYGSKIMMRRNTYTIFVGQTWNSKNLHYKLPYIVTGGVKFAGSEETPKGICYR